MDALPGFAIHHVGYACSSIAQEAKALTRLGYQGDGTGFEDPVQVIRGAFYSLGEHRIELLEPLADGGPLDGYLRDGVKLYHFGYTCTDFDAALDAMRQRAAVPVAAPVPAVAFDGREVCFFMLASGLLVELIDAGGLANPDQVHRIRR